MHTLTAVCIFTSGLQPKQVPFLMWQIYFQYPHCQFYKINDSIFFTQNKIWLIHERNQVNFLLWTLTSALSFFFVCKIIDITFPKGSIILLLRGTYYSGTLVYKWFQKGNNLTWNMTLVAMFYCIVSQMIPYRLVDLLYHLSVIWNIFVSFRLKYFCVKGKSFSVTEIFFSNEISHNIHLLFTHKDVFYYLARIYEPVLINECESRDICRLNKFHQCRMKKEDINNLSCILNLDKTTLLYWLFKAKCCLYCSTREQICKTYRLNKSFKNLRFNL